jgi:DNA-directed RNA polymerase sigma subunit (sigma70/sigma32)
MKILCILLFINFVKSLHLNNYQINLINNLIQNPLLQTKEREKINIILYKAYEKWAIKKAVDFKTFHKYNCRNIKTEELILASKMGLFKSIKKYNGKFNLINYASLYVKSELLNILTERY